MKGYFSLIKMRFILLLQYRAAAIAGVCTQLLFGFVRVMVIKGFYSSTSIPQPLTYEQTLNYIWISQAMLAMLPWNGDKEVQAMIKSGNISYELVRPNNLYWAWYSRVIALRTAPTLLRSIPIIFIASFLPKDYALSFPGIQGLVGWIISTFFALLLSAAMTNIITISTLWTISGEGVNGILPSFVTLFSGMVVPLPFFPQWFQKFIKFIPFSGVVDYPMKFFCGTLKLGDIIPYCANQFIWTIILIILGMCLLNKALKKVVILGG